ncbi:MAG: hypothetical protein H0W81_08455 [Chloroflexi bacterium]|nr:hypothetical protein [Chloroflexota bacterium]
MRTSRRLAIVISLLATFSLTFPALTAADHSWGGYHWARTANPFTLQLGDNVGTTWDGYLTTASSDWSSTSYDGKTDSFGKVVLNPLRTSVVTGAAKRNCRPTTGRVEVCNGSYGNNGWLGLASIWLNSSGHITQGTAKFNDTYFNLSAYNNPNEKQHVVCQEIGHTFGLDHQSTSGADLNTCMDYFSNTGSNATNTDSTHPNLHDYGELTYIYSHLETYATVKATAPTKAGPAQAPGFAGDGTPIGASPARGIAYVTDFGGGNVVITFVIWAE